MLIKTSFGMMLANHPKGDEGGLEKMRLFGTGNLKSRICDNHEEKPPVRRRSPAGINCRWEFFHSRSSPSAPKSGAAIIPYLFIPRAIGSFSPATAQHGETSPAADGQRPGYVRRQGV